MVAKAEGTPTSEGLPTCPLCGAPINAVRLDELEVSEEELDEVRAHVENRTLIAMLRTGEIAARYLQPETLGAEVQLNNALTKLSGFAKEMVKSQNDAWKKMLEDEKVDKGQIIKEAEERRSQIAEQYESEIKEIQEKVKEINEARLREDEEIRQHLTTIRERIAGPGIGRLSELGTITDLKAMVPSDNFEWKGPAGKSDIVGAVIFNSNGAGKIVVSRKQSESWSSSFINQLKKNMADENTKWGILSTEALPADALNDKLYLHSSGIIIVKPELTGIAYVAMREAVIQWAEARLWLKGKMSEAEYGKHLFKVLNEWVSGDKFQKFLESLEKAEEASQDTDDTITRWRAYANQKARKVLELQQELRSHLITCSGFLADLRKELKKVK